MLQIYDIIHQAAARNGVVNLGQALDNESSTIMFNNYKMMLDEFSIRSVNYSPYDYIVSASNLITIGTDTTNNISGTIPTLPAEIKEVVAIINGINYKLAIKKYEDYRAIPITPLNAIPEAVYILYNFPFITLYFYPGFNQSAFVRVYGRSYLISENPTINDYTNLPREFNQFLVSQLALKSAPYFGVAPSPGLITEANDALKHLKERELMREMSTLRNDIGGEGGFNYLSGLAGLI
jgi:hypothetical protein